MSVIAPVELRTDFDSAAVLLERQQAACSARFAALPVRNVRDWAFDRDAFWHGNCYNFAVGQIRIKYGFGSVIDRLKPGEISLRREHWPDESSVLSAIQFYRNPTRYRHESGLGQFDVYVRTRFEGAINDGFRYMGFDFSIPQDGCPVALFFKDAADVPIEKDPFLQIEMRPASDFHWAVLALNEKKEPIWLYKTPGHHVLAYNNPSDMFSKMREESYKHFAGYFCRPYGMDV